MAIITKYRTPGRIKARFVKKAPGQNNYIWCEQSADNPQYDLAQGTCEADDLPENIKKICDEYSGSFYATEWPI